MKREVRTGKEWEEAEKKAKKKKKRKQRRLEIYAYETLGDIIKQIEENGGDALGATLHYSTVRGYYDTVEVEHYAIYYDKEA